MTAPAQAAAGAGGFTMLDGDGDGALTCTDEACLMPGAPGAGTAESGTAEPATR